MKGEEREREKKKKSKKLTSVVKIMKVRGNKG